MKNGRKQIGLPIIVSTVLTTVMAIAFVILYGITKYLPLCLFALMCFLPSIINLIVMLMSLKLPLIECEDEAALSETDGEETDADGVGKRKGKRRVNGKGLIRGIAKGSKSIYRRLSVSYNKRRVAIASVISLLTILAIAVVFFLMMRRMTSLYTLNYLILIMLAVAFVVFVVLDKICAHANTDYELIEVMKKNIRSALILLRTVLILVMATVMISLLGLYDAQNILRYVLLAVWLYMTVFISISFVISIIKKELLTTPRLNIPAPFSIGESKDFGVISYLEENTGITMRSLWSIKMIKSVLPYTAAAGLVIFWAATGLVQVEANQRGAVYRFGKLLEEPLDPGLHICLPWPMDKVEIYDTETIKQFSVGYVSSESVDNTWTGEHGLNEYRLLLGSGDELVSVNLRIEYRIDDLVSYLRSNSNPVKLLESEAYGLITEKTIHTDLETLLSVDRNAFAVDFKDGLTEKIADYDTGIEIVSVILESIHPPVDIADIYQQLINAELNAETLIIEANGYAATRKLDAELRAHGLIALANIDNTAKIAAARSDVAEFMASVEADNEDTDAYRYYKYLDAIAKAYGDSKLVIVGDGIDSSNIYFGSFSSFVPETNPAN